jgi:ribosomal protein L17
MKSLAEALIINQSITTTLPKAKELRPYVEKMITKAKKGDLHNRRQIISSLQTVSSANKLVDEISPKLTTRTSGYLKIEKTTSRRGDNAEMATISFVYDLTAAPVAKPVVTKKIEEKPNTKTTISASKKSATTTTKKTATKKPAAKEKK